MRIGVTTLSLLLAAFMAASHAIAQDPANRLSSKTNWTVYVEDDPTECWNVATPQQTENTKDGEAVEVTRGEILLFVSYRPDDQIRGQVSFTGGYPFARGSTVTLEIGEVTFELLTDGEWAWPAVIGDDDKITTSMKRATNAVFTARSSRGTVTRDTFSLLGFAAATDEAERRCAS